MTQGNQRTFGYIFGYLGTLPDPLEDERNDRLEPVARPSLNPES